MTFDEFLAKAVKHSPLEGKLMQTLHELCPFSASVPDVYFYDVQRWLFRAEDIRLLTYHETNFCLATLRQLL